MYTLNKATATGDVDNWGTETTVSWTLTGSGCSVDDHSVILVSGSTSGTWLEVDFKFDDVDFGPKPNFRVHANQQYLYGVMAWGETLKVRNEETVSGSTPTSFDLALLTELKGEFNWLHDPTIQFEPPDTSGGGKEV